MDLREIMRYNVFVVVGDTLNEEKYAYKIKNELINSRYKVYSVGKELKSLNDIEEEVDIIDLCINPPAGIKLLKENKKNFKCIIIQPGAGSEEIIEYLEENNYPYIEGCLLVGIRLYGKYS
ncbi:CoA-binding protein [Terrisporobacter sp.]|uniref:CoA-binding protein n=1 Tax=Terrisporobacter sp. TaxID=1965305 RepID=UPI00262A6E34|nr:CoA-binding protein [Terrisporobacter sp.]